MDEAGPIFPSSWQPDHVGEEFNRIIANLPPVQRTVYFSAVKKGAGPTDALTAVMRLFTPDQLGERED